MNYVNYHGNDYTMSLLPPSASSASASASASASSPTSYSFEPNGETVTMPNDVITHILGYLQLRINAFINEDVKKSRRQLVRVMYGYRSFDEHRHTMLVFPSVLLLLNSLLQRVIPTTVYHFHSYELEAASANHRNAEDSSARITWKGHPNVHSLTYKRIQHTFGTSNHSYPNLTNFAFRVGTIVDSENLCRMLQKSRNLKRLCLHRNINLNTHELVAAISTLKHLTHLEISCYSGETPISLSLLLSCTTLQHIELSNVTICGTNAGTNSSGGGGSSSILSSNNDSNLLLNSSVKSTSSSLSSSSSSPTSIVPQCNTFIFSGNVVDYSSLLVIGNLKRLRHLSLLKENIPSSIQIQILTKLPNLSHYGTMLSPSNILSSSTATTTTAMGGVNTGAAAGGGGGGGKASKQQTTRVGTTRVIRQQDEEQGEDTENDNEEEQNNRMVTDEEEQFDEEADQIAEQHQQQQPTGTMNTRSTTTTQPRTTTTTAVVTRRRRASSSNSSSKSKQHQPQQASQQTLPQPTNIFEMVSTKPMLNSLHLQKSKDLMSWAPYLKHIQKLKVDEQFSDSDMKCILYYNPQLVEFQLGVPKYVTSCKITTKSLYYIGTIANMLQVVKIDGMCHANMDDLSQEEAIEVMSLLQGTNTNNNNSTVSNKTVPTTSSTGIQLSTAVPTTTTTTLSSTSTSSTSATTPPSLLDIHVAAFTSHPCITTIKFKSCVNLFKSSHCEAMLRNMKHLQSLYIDSHVEISSDMVLASQQTNAFVSTPSATSSVSSFGAMSASSEEEQEQEYGYDNKDYHSMMPSTTTSKKHTAVLTSLRLPNGQFNDNQQLHTVLKQSKLKVLQLNKITMDDVEALPDKINNTIEEIYDETGRLDNETLSVLLKKCTNLRMAPWFTYA